MKKILYVTTVSSTLNAFLIPHIKHLKSLGNKVDIACNLDQELSDEYMEDNIQFHKIDFSRNPISFNNKKAFKQIRDLYEKEKYDLINVHTPVASFITRLALRGEKVKMVYTCHGFHFYKGAPILNWIIYYPLEKLAGRYTDKIITINKEDFKRANKFKLREKGQCYLMHGVGIDSKNNILCEFDKDSYKRKLGLRKDDFIILILGEYNKNKNHNQIIKAMEILKGKYNNIKVLCAGKGPLERSLKDRVNRLGLENEIRFLGFRKDVIELNNIADCVALFSKREGLPRCLLEGMIASKPLIATNTRGPRELIENNKSGFLVDINNYNQTAKYIEDLYLDKNKRLRYGQRGKEKIKDYYIEDVVNEISEFIM